MINRRHHRPSGAVERLQQFCLNNSAGVDCTKPHNDVKSVFAAKNLVVNNDGSLSLRKPVHVRNVFPLNTIKVFPIKGPETVYFTVTDQGAYLLKVSENEHQHDLRVCPFKFVWTDVSGKRCEQDITGDSRTPINPSVLRFRNANAVDTGSGTVLSNCELTLRTPVSFFEKYYVETELHNPKLYDSDIDFVYRYVRVYFADDLQMWVVELHSPEMNTYHFDGDTVTHDFNTALDNPFAVRDIYDGTLPSVKTIRPYVYSDKVLGDVAPVKLEDLVNGAVSGQEVFFNKYAPTGISLRQYSDADDSDTVFFEGTLGTYVRVTDGNYIDGLVDMAFNSNFKIKLKCNKSTRKVTSATATVSVYFWNSGTVTYAAYDNLRVSGRYLIDTGDISGTYIDEHYGVFEYIDLTLPLSVVCSPDPYGVYDGVLRSYDFDITQQFQDFRIIEKGDTFENVRLSANPASPTDSDANSYLKLSVPNGMRVNKVSEDITQDITIAELTESVKRKRFRASTYLNTADTDFVVLKAFVDLPKRNVPNLYGSWQYTMDGVTWKDCLEGIKGDAAYVEEKDDAPSTDVSDNTTSRTRLVAYTPIRGESQQDVINLLQHNTYDVSVSESVSTRADCLVLRTLYYTEQYENDPLRNEILNSLAIRFQLKILSDIPVREEIIEHKMSDVSDPLHVVRKVYTAVTDCGYAELTLPRASVSEFEESDVGNTSQGLKKYNGSKLYSYGSAAFKNNIFYSYPNEFTTPITNVIDLTTSASEEVTSVTFWRDYVLSATPHTLHLSSYAQGGFLTKTVNTSFGIPSRDSRCCIPVLNGVVFKNDNKVYMLYPNVYSGEDSVLNVTEISQPVAHYLESYSDSEQLPFAFTTTSEYVLMLPQNDCTVSLHYDLTTRCWTVCEYPMLFSDVRTVTPSETLLYGRASDERFPAYCEWHYGASLKEFANRLGVFENFENVPYGDFMYAGGVDKMSINAVKYALSTLPYSNVSLFKVKPVSFELDTGQKADTIFTTKQFVETKIMFATLNKHDSFPMSLMVHIDGDPHVVKQDITTDAPFWKRDPNDIGVLNTTFNGLNPLSDSYNTLRQLVVRYSGKGKSVRHILSGQSLCDFKLYETYIRYKNLNVKQ